MTTNKLENFQSIDGGYTFMNLALEIAIANKLHLKNRLRIILKKIVKFSSVFGGLAILWKEDTV